MNKKQLREATKPGSATPIIELCFKMKDESKEVKEVGELQINQALINNKITPELLADCYARGLNESDLGVILLPINHPLNNTKPVIVSLPDTNIMNNKSWLKKQFKITVLTIEEAIKLIDKEKRQSK